MTDISTLTPQQTVKELDKHIIGQNSAKRAVAIALRNRWRRMNLEMGLQAEVTPTNILMIGPTGVGKTEIARRLAKLTQAPFIKVEATKFTEVGYVGRDVESIIRDLVEVGIKEERKLARQQIIAAAEKAVEERILDVLLPPRKGITEEEKNSSARQAFRKQLQQGSLEATEIEVDIAIPPASLEIIGSHPGLEDITNQIQSMFQSNNNRTQTRKLKISEARKVLLEEESNKLLNEEEIKARAIVKIEQQGIVFIDEIDKVAKRAEHSSGGDVSREGVQRDLLPLVEGSTVSTKYGMIKTDYILFIASGAFHVAKPSDLIPELQGRFPIRVELSDLSVDDFIRILTETDASLISQYTALLATEKVALEFTQDGIQSMATSAWEANQLIENIGARRLKTVMGHVLEEISFEASERPGESLIIDKTYVEERLAKLLKKQDLMRYIL